MKNRAERNSFTDQSHILIVGDDSEEVVRLQALLEQHDYQVSTAAKGSDAHRQILDAEPGVIALVPQVPGQQNDRASIVTENAQLMSGEMSPQEIPLTREMLDGDYSNLIGESAALLNVLNNIEIFAKSPTAVLISGETGTGKELVARALHSNSNRSEKEMIIANCAAISESLVENEFFGHERGHILERIGNTSACLKQRMEGHCSLMKSGNSPCCFNQSCYGHFRKARSDASGGTPKFR